MAIIPRITEGGKEVQRRLPEGAIILAVVVLSSCLSFGLGFLTGKETKSDPVRIETIPLSTSTGEATSLKEAPREEASSATLHKVESAPALPSGGQYVASKNGTKYHLPWCSGAKQMKEKNKVWFN